MSGREKGFQAIVKESCPLAVHVHCSAHVLNLVLVKSCAIPEIHSTFNFMGDIASFFSNNDIYSKIYQKAADMVSPEATSMPRIVKHQTMRSNVPAESSENYYLRNLYYSFLDSVSLQLDQQFSGHAEAVMRLSSLLPANVVTANFCEVEPAVNLFLPLL